MQADVLTKITHEFRSPLTIALGLLRHIREQKDLSSSSIRYLEIIERQCKNLTDLINQMIDFATTYAREHKMEWKTGNIVAFIEMIAETVRIHAEEKNIQLMFYCEEPEIITDFVPDYLHKIIFNLLTNAIKYSPEGSRVFLSLERKKNDGKTLVIKVVDQGVGISPDILPRIFDLFYKAPTKSKTSISSNGIGLALVKELVNAMEGSISVESTKKKGSIFSVELPLQKDENKLRTFWRQTKESPPQLHEGNREEKNENTLLDVPGQHSITPSILLAEDNNDVAFYIRSIFHESKYNILCANNGEEAFKMINDHLPDVVITDVIMPKMSGLELCKRIKNSPLLNHIPVIIISAKNKDEDILEGLKSGADYFLNKPFYPDELRVRVNNLLESRRLLKEKYRRSIVRNNDLAKNQENGHSEFLRPTTDIIYREMKNPDFTSGQLASELAIR